MEYEEEKPKPHKKICLVLLKIHLFLKLQPTILMLHLFVYLQNNFQ